MKNLLEVKSYQQPGSWNTIIRLERYADECWRYVNDKWQCAWKNAPESTIRWAFSDWISFEEKIGSKLL